jgi:hypothetical protein
MENRAGHWPTRHLNTIRAFVIPLEMGIRSTAKPLDSRWSLPGSASTASRLRSSELRAEACLDGGQGGNDGLGLKSGFAFYSTRTWIVILNKVKDLLQNKKTRESEN